MLEAAKGDKYECLYVLSPTCGLRMGEALGFNWSELQPFTNCKGLRLGHHNALARGEGSLCEVCVGDAPAPADQALRRNSLYAASPNPISKTRAPTDTSGTHGTPPVLGSRSLSAAEAESPPAP